MRWLLALAALPAFGHIGSPDVFFEGKAGPYPVLVTVRPPAVIPGLAEVEIRAPEGVSRVQVAPLPLTGEAANFAPTPDEAVRAAGDSRSFTGTLWMMTTGSWQVRVTVDGPQGRASLSVPVAAVAQRTQAMNVPLGIALALLGLLLSAGVVSIAGAAVRESQLAAGVEPDEARRGAGRRSMAIASAIVVVVLVLGNLWWKAEAGDYDRYIYKPLELGLELEPADRLVLRLRDPGWLSMRKLNDFIPDHTHLMHLYAVSLPAMDRVWHLHPEERTDGEFVQHLPAMPPGRYRFYGDLVHENGFPETVTAEMELPAVAGHPLQGDDSGGAILPGDPVPFDDGMRMVFLRDKDGYRTRKPYSFQFRLENADGSPASGMELYMGMPGHAAFIERGQTVFAHVHPSGSVPMASLSLTDEAKADPHAGHVMMAELPPTVSFPYGFPKAGEYRVIVQMKQRGAVRTAAFDVTVRD